MFAKEGNSRRHSPYLQTGVLEIPHSGKLNVFVAVVYCFLSVLRNKEKYLLKFIFTKSGNSWGEVVKSC